MELVGMDAATQDSLARLQVRYLELLLRKAEIHLLELRLRNEDFEPADQLLDRIEALLGFDRSRVAPELPAVVVEPAAQLAPVAAAADSEPDRIARPEAPAESVEVDNSPDTLPARRYRGGRVSKVPCTVNPSRVHHWEAPADLDGWFRCRHGCGAGRTHLSGGEILSPDELDDELAGATVPTAAADVRPPRRGYGRPAGTPRRIPTVPCAPGIERHKWGGVREDDGRYHCANGCGVTKDSLWGTLTPPSVAQASVQVGGSSSSSSTEAAEREPANLDEDEPEPAPIDLPDFDKPVNPRSRVADDEGDWGDFGLVDGGLEDDPPAARDVDLDEREEDDGGVVRPRAGTRTLDPASFAPLVGRDDTPAHLVRLAECPRCRQGQLARDVLELGDPTAWACISCGHRPRLSREEAWALERELGARPGKQRARQPYHRGARL